MANTFVDVSAAEVRTGEWVEKLSSQWKGGNLGLPRVSFNCSDRIIDNDLTQAIGTMLDSNGSYIKGNHAFIHARLSSLDMALKTSEILSGRGIDSDIVLGLAQSGEAIHKLMESIYGKNADLKSVDPSILQGLANNYKTALEALRGKGHWIVTMGNAPDNAPQHIDAVNLYTRFVGMGLSQLGDMRKTGELISHDIWLNPCQMDVDRLNEGLSAEKHWNLSEWRTMVFQSMAVSSDRLEKIAMDIEAVRHLIYASKNGGTLKYQREDGTNLTFSVEERPIILDRGRVGKNSLGGTSEFYSRITNQPTTEVFVAPIETSVNGWVVYPVPMRTSHGVINAKYHIHFNDGQVDVIEAPDEASAKILNHYTGQHPFDGRTLDGDESMAFSLSKVIAEFAIAGFNPVMQPHILSGRLYPGTGVTLIDEKLGDHQACGANDLFNGRTQSHVGDYSVMHTDFVGTIDRHMKFE